MGKERYNAVEWGTDRMPNDIRVPLTDSMKRLLWPLIERVAGLDLETSDGYAPFSLFEATRLALFGMLSEIAGKRDAEGVVALALARTIFEAFNKAMDPDMDWTAWDDLDPTTQHAWVKVVALVIEKLRGTPHGL